nr:Hpt domain-containing protein [Azospirillum sp. B4]
MDELLEQFLIEGPEQVQQAGEALLALEDRPDDAGLIDQAFRAIHTLKGSVGLFDLPAMGQVLHAAEDLLGGWRDGRLALTRPGVDALIAATGQTERWLGALAAAAGTLPADAGVVAADLAGRLRRFLDEDAPPVPVAPAADAAWAAALFQERGLDAAHHPQVTALRYTPDAGCYFRGEDPIAFVRQVPDLLALRIGRRTGAAEMDTYDAYACDLVVELLSAAPLEAVKAPFRFVPDQIQVSLWAPSPAATTTSSAVVEPMATPQALLRVDRGPRRRPGPIGGRTGGGQERPVRFGRTDGRWLGPGSGGADVGRPSGGPGPPGGAPAPHGEWGSAWCPSCP